MTIYGTRETSPLMGFPTASRMGTALSTRSAQTAVLAEGYCLWESSAGRLPSMVTFRFLAANQARKGDCVLLASSLAVNGASGILLQKVTLSKAGKISLLDEGGAR